MKRKVLAGVLLGLFFTAATFALPVTKIQYQATDLGSGRWQYTYNVTNISLTPAIKEFTIWFDYGLYENLAVEIPKSGWDEVIIEAEPVLGDDGYYDALTLGLGIGISETISGFAVSFDWLGAGQPGSQFYEIIDPDTFETIDSGYTIPEPATIFLLGLGGLALRKSATKAQRKK